MNHFVINDPRTAPFVAAQCHGTNDFGEHTSIGVERDGHIIAGVIFNQYNTVSASIHVGAKCGSRWCSRSFLKFVFGYAFDGLKLRRLTGIVASGNVKARTFDEHLGFTLEARLKDADPTGDLLVYRMFREDCRFLNYGKKQS